MINHRVTNIDFEKVGKLISRKYLSWAELARQANISSATIFAIKAGRRNASYKTLRNIANALGVEPSDIVSKD